MSTEETIDRKLNQQPKVDEESGSFWDWTGFGVEALQLTDEHIITRSERAWINGIEDMLDKGGVPMKVYIALTQSIRMANLRLEEPEDDDEDVGQFDFIRNNLLAPPYQGGMATPLEDIIAQMAHGIAVKRTYHEKVYTKDDDGKIILKKLAWRPPGACEQVRNLDTGELEGFRQWTSFWGRDDRSEDTDSEGYSFVPKSRAMIYIHGSHRNPLNGVSDLSVTYWAYELKMKVLNLWHTYLDREALGKVITYGQTKGEANKRAQAISKLRGAGVVGIERDNPEEDIYDLIESPSTTTQTFENLLNYLDSEMTGSIMANWLDLASKAASGTGSYALSADQSSLFIASRFAVAKEIARTITSEIIAPLVEMNFGPDVAIPELKIEKIDSEQNTHIIELMKAFSTAATIRVPEEFLHMLVKRTAQYLDLSEEEVGQMLEEEKERLEKERERTEKQQDAMVAGAEQSVAAANQQDPQGAQQRSTVTNAVSGANNLVKKGGARDSAQ